MCRTGVRLLCLQVAGQFQTPICFPTVKLGLILEEKVEKKKHLHYLNELDDSHYWHLSLEEKEPRLFNWV